MGVRQLIILLDSVKGDALHICDIFLFLHHHAFYPLRYVLCYVVHIHSQQLIWPAALEPNGITMKESDILLK